VIHRHWRQALYTTNLVDDSEDGWTALHLHRNDGDTDALVARVVFWDAEGQFSIELVERELPLEMVEEFIAEAKAVIKLA
jgi:hypothetical protein